MSRINLLAAAIAHEISQPLASVLANGYAARRWLAMEPPNLEEVRNAVAEIILATDRACTVTAGIRDLLSKRPRQDVLVDINETILQALTLADSELKSSAVTLRTEFASDLPAVAGDPVQLQQVVLNLVTNGVEAMSSIDGQSRELSIRSAIDPSGVLIQVCDSGRGFKSSVARKIFEPFFTTKPHSLGLGLSISRSIIEAHGGLLWAVSEHSHGAVFQFNLPKAKDFR